MRKLTEKLWNGTFFLMTLTNTFCAFSFYMVMTILSKYIINIGFSLATSGVVIGTFSVTSLLIRPFTGYVADRMNQKKWLLFSNTLCVIALIGYVCTPNIIIIMMARILHGIGFGINSTVVISAAVQEIPEE